MSGKSWVSICLLFLYCPVIFALQSVMAFLEEGLPDLRMADKRAALEMWAKDLGEMESIDASIYPAKDIKDLLAGIENRQISSALLNTGKLIEYYQQLLPHLTSDIMIIKRHEGEYEDFVIVTHQDSNIRDLQSLKRKNISLVDEYTLLNDYLSYLVKTHFKQNQQQFFSRIISNKTSSHSVLDVFFKRSDAAIVARHIFDLAADLNPRLKKDLRIIHHSGEKFIPAVIVMFKNAQEVNTKFKKNVLLHQQTLRGQQLLELFKINGVQEGKLENMQPSFFIYELCTRQKI